MKSLEVVGLCALTRVIYFLIPQSLRCKIGMVPSPTSERHCNEMALAWCLRGTQEVAALTTMNKILLNPKKFNVEDV